MFKPHQQLNITEIEPIEDARGIPQPPTFALGATPGSRGVYVGYNPRPRCVPVETYDMLRGQIVTDKDGNLHRISPKRFNYLLKKVEEKIKRAAEASAHKTRGPRADIARENRAAAGLQADEVPTLPEATKEEYAAYLASQSEQSTSTTIGKYLGRVKD